MSDMWLDLLPVLFALMISPARTLAVIVLFHTPRRSATALAYVVGMVTAMMIQGAAFGAVLNIVGLVSSDRSADLAIFVAALFVVGGVILIAGALKIAFLPRTGGGSLASVLNRIENVPPSGAYKIGVGWLMASPKQWVFVMTAVAVIFLAELRTVASLGTFLIFTLLVQLVYLMMIAANVLAADSFERVLDSVFVWIRAHLKPLAIGIFLVFGVVFLMKGLVLLV